MHLVAGFDSPIKGIGLPNKNLKRVRPEKLLYTPATSVTHQLPFRSFITYEKMLEYELRKKDFSG